VVIQLPTDTRRELLSTGAAGLAVLAVTGGAGAGLAGCGGTSGPHRRGRLGPPGESDVDLLNSVLATEQQAIAAYTAVTPLLGGTAQRAAARFLAQDLAHAGELRALIKRVGGHPHQPSAGSPVGSTVGRIDLLEALHRLEQAQIAAYLTAIPAVSTRLLRAALASMMANDAQHVVTLRAELGLAPLTTAFLTAAS
jgi:bacterioferritin (cytochrome b1)